MSSGRWGIRFTVPAQEAIIPLLFAYRYGPSAGRWYADPHMRPALRFTEYLVGLPRGIVPEGLRKALPRSVAVSHVSVTQLPEGPLATVHVPPDSLGLHEGLHGKDLFDAPIFVIGGETTGGTVLQRVLQAHAESRLRQQLIGMS